MGVRCDVAQVAFYFPGHGRVGAPGIPCSVVWQGSCVQHPCASLPSSPGLGSGHCCQALEGHDLLGTVLAVSMFPNT